MSASKGESDSEDPLRIEEDPKGLGSGDTPVLEIDICKELVTMLELCCKGVRSVPLLVISVASE